MTELVVRRLLIDLETPIGRHWHGGDAFRSAYFNALSMSFPAGEQFFIDAVRAGVNALPQHDRVRFENEVQAFIGQEATHRRIHALFNAHLTKQGLVNHWEPRIVERNRMLAGANPRHAVAITAATEHLTAIFAEHLLSHRETLDACEERLRTLWLWHSAEESEHRSTAFDVYRALGGDEPRRRRWMRLVTLYFVTDVLRQTAYNLLRDGELWRWSTWRSAASFLFGHAGLVRHTIGPWRAYFSPRFHPRQQGGDLGRQWLLDNAAQYTPVNGRA